MGKDDHESTIVSESDRKGQKYPFEALSKKVIGAAIKVHRELGPDSLKVSMKRQ